LEGGKVSGFGFQVSEGSVACNATATERGAGKDEREALNTRKDVVWTGKKS
jgi:hypothetical protein